MFPIYLDQDTLDGSLVRALIANGIDVLTTTEVGNTNRSDEEQLTYATAAGRAVVSGNRADFARLHHRWIADGRAHGGIILRRRLPPQQQIAALLDLQRRMAYDEVAGALVFA